MRKTNIKRENLYGLKTLQNQIVFLSPLKSPTG